VLEQGHTAQALTISGVKPLTPVQGLKPFKNPSSPFYFMGVREDAYRYAVKNAFQHGGKADAGAVIGKAKALYPDKDVKDLVKDVQAAVKEANALPAAKLKAEFDRFDQEGWELRPKQKEIGLLSLEWAEGPNAESVVTRFAPNPNGPFHLGNLRAAYMSYAYAKKYGGRFILRFEDTDAKIKKPIENAERLFLEDLKWLECVPDEVFWASQRFDLYYDYLRKLIDRGKAYACNCESGAWRKLIEEKTACPCRAQKPAETLRIFEKMVSNEAKEGEYVLRLKTDLNHPDPSVRDWWLARCVDEPEHNRMKKKVHVWPSFMFQNSVDDHEMGVTLIIRGQEHSQNVTKQRFLYDYFGWRFPHAFHTGRLKLEGIILSKSDIKKGIEEGRFEGWEDPRLGTIRALRRRGFDARALKDVLMEVGVAPNDATISMSKLIDYNKKYIEAESERMTFVAEPVELTVKNAPVGGAEKATLAAGAQKFWVAGKPLGKLKPGAVFRLKNAFNVKLASFDGKKAAGEAVAGGVDPKIVGLNWLVDGGATAVAVKMADASVRHGVAESRLAWKKPGERAYFDKFGFVRVDEQGKSLTNVWFTHE